MSGLERLRIRIIKNKAGRCQFNFETEIDSKAYHFIMFISPINSHMKVSVSSKLGFNAWNKTVVILLSVLLPCVMYIICNKISLIYLYDIG